MKQIVRTARIIEELKVNGYTPYKTVEDYGAYWFYFDWSKEIEELVYNLYDAGGYERKGVRICYLDDDRLVVIMPTA